MKEQIDISNMSLEEYLGIPEDVIINTPDWMFSFKGDKIFYQFFLKNGFKDTLFSLSDIESKYSNLYYQIGNIDFETKEWESRLIGFITSSPKLITQVFDEESKRVLLKLTDEAFKI